MNSCLNVGIVGLGFMGAVHLQAYSRLPNVRVAAIASNNDAALAGDLSKIGGNQQLSTQQYDFSGVGKYRDWRELVGDAAVDAVDICLPTDLHEEVARAAFAAGKHVFCEKPMALTTAACDRMMEAAAQANRILMIGQVLRFWPEYLALARFVTSGEYGRVLSATFVRSCGLPDWSNWLPVEERSGGALLDLLVHDIDQALALFGAPSVVNCKAFAGPESAMATLVYPGGPEVRVQGGWFAPGTPLNMSFTVRAERGELNFSAEGLWLNDHAGKRRKVEVDTAAGGYDAEIAYFAECCLDTRQPERCPPSASALAVRVALLLKQSRALGGQPVECKG